MAIEKHENGGDEHTGLRAPLGWWGRATEFISEVRNEMKRVTWPSRREVYATTVVVILTSVFFGLYLFAWTSRSSTLVQASSAVRCRVMSETTATKNWYIVHTYSGFEKKVAESLQQRVQAYGLQDEIGEVLIPTEDVVEMRGGKKVVSSKRFFPGYILVEMNMTDNAWHVVKNTPKVTGICRRGRQADAADEGGSRADSHAGADGGGEAEAEVHLRQGRQVRINEGPFAGFNGVVDEVNTDKNTLKVMVTIFGRSTPVELDFLQVEKL